MNNWFSLPRLSSISPRLLLCAAIVAVGCAQGEDLERPPSDDAAVGAQGGAGAGGTGGLSGTGGVAGTDGSAGIGGAGGSGGVTGTGGASGTGGADIDAGAGAGGDDSSVGGGGTGGTGGDVDASLPDGSAGLDGGGDVSVGNCSDLVKNGTETDTDCGGSCAPTKKCGDGLGCAGAQDCQSGICTGGTCRVFGCSDGVKDGTETDIDCGGSCAPAKQCADGLGCAGVLDCQSGVCTGLVCQAVGCNDGVKNGTETDTDCGGSCSPTKKCVAGQACGVAADCQSANCLGAMCQVATCLDGVKNTTETDIDCGGNCAPGKKCVDGKACAVGSDCQSAACFGQICQPVGCGDTVRNGTETDVDCGGTCTKCVDTKLCAVAGDCQSGVCFGTPLRCQVPTCTDSAKNGTETDLNCGGTCPACVDNKACLDGADCQSGVCSSTSLTCIASSCNDGVKNGSETAVDCGGSCAPTQQCADTFACLLAVDCQSGVCSGAPLACQAPICGDGVKNGTEPGQDCGGPCLPTKCPAGQGCAGAGDCASGVCSGTPLTCQAPSCFDGLQNGDETAEDCGGSCAPAKQCADTLGCAVAADCQSGVCSAPDGGAPVCQAPICGDGVKNGTEPGQDCGGPCLPTVCPAGQGCTGGADCASGVCSGTPLLCQAPGCNDGLKNGSETGVDCGGSCAPLKKCADNLGCLLAGDCQSGVCSGAPLACQVPACNDTVQNGTEVDVDCGGTCPACPLPGTPTGLILTKPSNFRMHLVWDAADVNTKSWKLDWTINGVAANASPIVLAVGTTSYDLTELNVNSTYEFSLKGSNNAGDSATAAIASAASFTIAGHALPIKEGRIEASGYLHFSVYVGNTVDEVLATTYTAYYSSTPQRPATGNNMNGGGNEKYWTSPGFLTTTPVYLWARAQGPDGALIWSYTLLPGLDMTGAITFSNVTKNAVTLSWPAAGNTGYRCRWSATATKPSDNTYVQPVTTAGSTTCTINGLVSGTTYNFWVETTGAAITNGAPVLGGGLPGVVGLSGSQTTAGQAYVLVPTNGLPTFHNATFGVAAMGAEVTPSWADSRAWDGDLGSLWGFNDGKFTRTPPTTGTTINEFGAPVVAPWVAVDLGATPPVVNSMIILWQNACAYVYRLEGTNDLAGAWTTLADVCKVGGGCALPTNTSGAAPMQFEFANGTAYRYIRLIMPSNLVADYYNTNYGAKLYDIALYKLP